MSEYKYIYLSNTKSDLELKQIKLNEEIKSHLNYANKNYGRKEPGKRDLGEIYIELNNVEKAIESIVSHMSEYVVET